MSKPDTSRKLTVKCRIYTAGLLLERRNLVKESLTLKNTCYEPEKNMVKFNSQ